MKNQNHNETRNPAIILEVWDDHYLFDIMPSEDPDYVIGRVREERPKARIVTVQAGNRSDPGPNMIEPVVYDDEEDHGYGEDEEYQ